MKKKIALLCVMVMSVGTVFAACSSNSGTEELITREEADGENDGDTSGDGDEMVEEAGGEKIKLIFARAGTETERKDYWAEMIEGFEAENPNIEIEYQEAPYGDDFETKLNTGFASGTAPDIINFTMASMGTRVPLGQYAELDPYMAEWDGSEDFMENALELGQINDITYGIPVFPDPRILIYNKELFEDAGLDPNSPPATWDELMEYHEKLVVMDGDDVVQTGFAMPTSGTSMQHYYSIFAMENGVKNIVDEDDHTILCNTPESIEAVEFMYAIKEAGIIPWDSGNGDQNPFASGLAAMTIGTDQNFKEWNEAGMEGKIAMASPMKNTEQATFCGMNFLFMSGETEYPDEVWKFIEYVSNAENMWKRYEDLGMTPLRKSLENDFVSQSPETNAIIFESVNYGSGSPKVSYANSVYNIINEAMEKVMYDVDTAENAMNDAAVKIQEEIDNQ